MHSGRNETAREAGTCASCARNHAQGAAVGTRRPGFEYREHIRAAGLFRCERKRACAPDARPQPRSFALCAAVIMPRWFLWTLLALVSWGVWAVLAKLIGDALSAAQSQALSTLGLLPIFAMLAVSKKPSAAPKRGRGRAAAFAAGVCGCLGNLAYYHALNSGGKAVIVVPLTALYPLVTIVLAVVILKEQLNRIQLSGIILSIVAIYLFNVQREEGFWN